MGKNRNPTVSIVTVSQIKRQGTIKLTLDHVNNQNYKNIIEWVIVEGSKNIEDCLANEEFIKTLKCNNVPIVYIPGHTDGIFNNNHLGELRNLTNKKSKGEIIVVMDDDDWYPKTRVSHAVNMLVNSKALIAGCSSKYLYDYDIEVLLQFKQFGPNHSTNDCFAYKRSYLENNSYDPSKDMAEESSFTKDFSNKMVQLDPKHTIIGSSHSFNTFNKKEICITSCLLKNPFNPTEGNLYPMSFKSEDTVENLMGKEMVEKYTNFFINGEQDQFDISYFCGGTSIDWDFTSQSLGGSEQAVVNLANEWTKLGKKVAVYGKLLKEGIFNNVSYFSWKNFPFHKEHQIVILWRMSGINCGLQFKIRTKKLLVDYHDNNFVFRHPYTPYTDRINRIFFKSEFHLEEYQKFFKIKLEPEQYSVILNGIRIDEFRSNDLIQREPYRFCYCSCYSRGLEELLTYVWPLIYQNEPRAELHVYYGIQSIDDPEMKQKLTMLMGQPGVMDHGRRPVDEIAKEKQKSTFHLYITDCIGETDCISIRESLVAGCIPLISNSGVFKNRDGLRFNLDKTPEGYKNIAIGILNVLQKPEFLDIARQQFSLSKTICSWKDVAEQWIDLM
jgi:hypothetical protein